MLVNQLEKFRSHCETENCERKKYVDQPNENKNDIGMNIHAFLQNKQLKFKRNLTRNRQQR